MLYFEDAREAFGKRYGLDYLTIFQNGYYAPLVDINFQYKRPMVYGKSTVIEITYLPTEAAKIVFEYKITDETGDLIYAKGKSTQVFMDMKAYKRHTMMTWYDDSDLEEATRLGFEF